MKYTIPTQTAVVYQALSDARNAMLKMQSELNDDMQVQSEPIFKHIEDAATELGALLGNKISNELFFDTITHE